MRCPEPLRKTLVPDGSVQGFFQLDPVERDAETAQVKLLSNRFRGGQEGVLGFDGSTSFLCGIYYWRSMTA